MSVAQCILLIMIIHMLCVIHLFSVFDRFGYEPCTQERIFVWVCAPEILFMIILIMLIRGGK